MKLFLTLPSSFERAIPIGLMGVLALVSFSLLKSSPSASVSVAAPSVNPFDYYLQHFSTAQLNDDGILKSFIRGRYAEHSPNSQTIFVQDFLFASTTKHNSYIGRSELASLTDDANQLTLNQNAAIKKTPIKQRQGEEITNLKSNHLTFSQYPEIVISEVPVNIEQNNRKIYAKSMYYNADDQQMRLTGTVKIEVPPKIIN